MKQYHDFLQHILDFGVTKDDRTGTGTISAVVPPQMRFNMRDGFPIVNTKEVNFEAVKHELKWFTSGDTNIKYLLDNNVNIWNADAYRWYCEYSTVTPMSKKNFINRMKSDESFAEFYGELGPIYGAQWRNFDNGEFYGIDQLAEVVENIKEIKAGNHQSARRLLVTAWNPRDVKISALPPCHVLMQLFVVGDYLSLHLYQRSGDAFLGIPFNISSYSLLLYIIAKETGLKAGEFIHTVGDAHIYLNHLDQVREQLSRESYELPQLLISKRMGNTLDGWEPDDYILQGYKHHPAIKGELSV